MATLFYIPGLGVLFYAICILWGITVFAVLGGDLTVGGIFVGVFGL